MANVWTKCAPRIEHRMNPSLFGNDIFSKRKTKFACLELQQQIYMPCSAGGRPADSLGCTAVGVVSSGVLKGPLFELKNAISALGVGCSANLPHQADVSRTIGSGPERRARLLLPTGFNSLVCPIII
ncbi:hypothetical protein O181_012832 [Austropuccinia psidii MF-1]|uniref:Uncharacterized protein n=1 Tax=Austropuccinia psidii MF-1 TaxID=1389203 RepID=A0A9Q3BYG0_9BASI|nr:hypothetical protein [Austropuccinia psidii MF-1]